MHIHKFERFWIKLSFVMIAFFIATVVFGFIALDLKVIGDTGTIDPQNLQDTPFGKPGVREVVENGETKYDIYVKTFQFAFQPGTAQPIVVPVDTEVTFYITSPDVLHGFDVAGTNLNSMAIPGHISKMTTKFPEVREYGILCNEYCGPAHHIMEGKIKVVPKSEFDKSYLVE